MTTIETTMPELSAVTPTIDPTRHIGLTVEYRSPGCSRISAMITGGETEAEARSEAQKGLDYYGGLGRADVRVSQAHQLCRTCGGKGDVPKKNSRSTLYPPRVKCSECKGKNSEVDVTSLFADMEPIVGTESYNSGREAAGLSPIVGLAETAS